MYRVEDLKFLNMEKVPWIPADRDSGKIFVIEEEWTLSEKIAFIDDMYDGLASYMVDVINQWEMDRAKLPRRNNGAFLVGPYREWLKKNDPRGVINAKTADGSYHFLSKMLSMVSLMAPRAHPKYRPYQDGHHHIGHLWFHLLCEKLMRQEFEYHRNNDPVYQKLRQVKDFAERYGILDNEVISDIYWNAKTDVPEDMLDAFLGAYTQVQVLVDNLTKTLPTYATKE